MNQLEVVDAAYALLRETLNVAEAEHLRCQTPCRDFDVSELAEHLIASITRISAAAGVAVPISAQSGLRERVAHTGQQTLAGWRRRGIEGSVAFGGRSLPAADLLGVIGLEFLVHAWDLAVAIGYELAVPDQLANAVLQLARRTLTADSRRVAGFDAPAPVAEHASALDQLVAFTGRQPRRLLR